MQANGQSSPLLSGLPTEMVLVISSVLCSDQERSRGNQLIYRRIAKTKPIGRA